MLRMFNMKLTNQYKAPILTALTIEENFSTIQAVRFLWTRKLLAKIQYSTVLYYLWLLEILIMRNMTLTKKARA